LILLDVYICIHLVVSDKSNTYITRYINKKDETPPSLYFLKKKDEIIFSSEPLEKNNPQWTLIEKNKILNINNFDIKIYDI
jgi:predicted glutamine amidotransferase